MNDRETHFSNSAAASCEGCHAGDDQQCTVGLGHRNAGITERQATETACVERTATQPKSEIVTVDKCSGKQSGSN